MSNHKNILSQILIKCKENDISSAANQLTYKILLSFFPFVIFLISVVASLNLDIKIFLSELENRLPSQVFYLIKAFIEDIVGKRNLSLASSSFLISIISGSSGFEATVKCINKIYGSGKQRNIFLSKLISLICMIMFSVIIALCIISIVLGNKIFTLLQNNTSVLFEMLFMVFRYLFSMIFLTLFAVIIYKISFIERVKFDKLLPGATFCGVFWILISMLFNFYVSNFARYSMAYGSIAGIFIMMIWINLLINILLIGCQINCLVMTKKATTKGV